MKIPAKDEGAAIGAKIAQMAWKSTEHTFSKGAGKLPIRGLEKEGDKLFRA